MAQACETPRDRRCKGSPPKFGRTTTDDEGANFSFADLAKVRLAWVVVPADLPAGLEDTAHLYGDRVLEIVVQDRREDCELRHETASVRSGLRSIATRFDQFISSP